MYIGKGKKMNERIKELAKDDLVRSEYTEFGWQECHKYEFDEQELLKFAELIRQDEREACAKLFDAEVWSYDYREIAATIRARSRK